MGLNFKLMHGEQSYLDWREQTYPRWMQPKDIYESMCLGTNVMYAEAFRVRDAMIKELESDYTPLWIGMDKEIANSINNNLWIPNLGYYSEYLYGGVYPIQSQAVDNLGQALSIVFDIANPRNGPLDNFQDSLHALWNIIGISSDARHKALSQRCGVAVCTSLLEHRSGKSRQHSCP